MGIYIYIYRLGFVGDKINPEETWILIRKHLGVTSRSYISDICYVPAKEDRLGIMMSRSYQTRRRCLIGANISRIFMSRRFDRSHETIREVESQPDI
jgi:hypothetical protein